MRRHLSSLWLVCLGLVIARPAAAALISYEIQGTVSGGLWTQAGQPLLGVIPIGTPASLRWSVDSGAPDTNPDPAVNTYALAEPGGIGDGGLDVYGLHLQILGEGRLGATAPILGLTDRAGTLPDTLFGDMDVVEPPCDPPGPGCPGVAVIHSLQFAFNKSQLLLSGSPAPIPPTALAPGGVWALFDASISDPLLQFSPGTIQAVPEPSLLGLLALSALVTRSFAASGAFRRASAPSHSSCCSSTSARSGR
jgi:hypothetical protein